MNFQAERAYFIAYLEELFSSPFGDLPDPKPSNKLPRDSKATARSRPQKAGARPLTSPEKK